jgi:hypothetical protein
MARSSEHRLFQGFEWRRRISRLLTDAPRYTAPELCEQLSMDFPFSSLIKLLESDEHDRT